MLFRPSSKNAASKFSRKLTTVKSSRALLERPVGGGGGAPPLAALVEVVFARGMTMAEDDAARTEKGRMSDRCMVIVVILI